MVTKVVTEVFQTTDGKVFNTKEEAEKHESLLTDIKYFYILYGADLNEGRSCLDTKAIVSVNAKASHAEFIQVLCHNAFGSMYQFCQGVFGSNAIMPYWSIGGEMSSLPLNSKVSFAIEERFAKVKQYGEGMWDLRSDKPKQISY